MRGITIIKDNIHLHTGDDLDLIQEVKELGNPTPQSYLVEVPGRNGLLNLTKGLTGNVCYKNRSLRFQYLGSGDKDILLDTVDLFNTYHGETIKIIDDDTPDWYYEGEATVSVKRNGVLVTITLDVDADPFRQRLELTNRVTDLTTDAKNIVINNYGVTVAPTVIVSNNAQITFKGTTYTLSAGTYTIDNLELKPGSNILTVSGSGNLTIQYREAKI